MLLLLEVLVKVLLSWFIFEIRIYCFLWPSFCFNERWTFCIICRSSWYRFSSSDLFSFFVLRKRSIIIFGWWSSTLVIQVSHLVSGDKLIIRWWICFTHHLELNFASCCKLLYCWSATCNSSLFNWRMFSHISWIISNILGFIGVKSFILLNWNLLILINFRIVTSD